MSAIRLLSGIAAGVLCAALPVKAQPNLPEGAGKAIVETACLGCHEPIRITNAGYNRQDWQNVVHMMLNVGAPVPQDQIGVVSEYLAKNFPEKPKPTPSIVAGNADVE